MAAVAQVERPEFLNLRNQDGYGGTIGSPYHPTADSGYGLPSSNKSQFDGLSHSESLAALDQGIIDIRRKSSSPLDLYAQCIEGLSKPFGSKFLPPLLLWDEKGQSLYNEILATENYYPYRVENELLEQCVHDIANKINSTGSEMLIELGAGNMRKITSLLSALDALGKPLTYYALDVDRAELEASLSSLRARTNLRNIKLRALLGTYEDGAYWLSTAHEARSTRKALIWLGSSIANFMPQEAGELLASLTRTQNAQNFSGFILAVDGCRDETKIECAYDTVGGQSRRWIKYVLEAARNRLGPEAAELLDDDNWRFEGRWNAQRLRYESYLCVAKPLTSTIGGVEIRLKRGEEVEILGSGKWTKTDVGKICAKQSLDIVEWWDSSEVDYSKPQSEPKYQRSLHCMVSGVYWLQLAP